MVYFTDAMLCDRVQIDICSVYIQGESVTRGRKCLILQMEMAVVARTAAVRSCDREKVVVALAGTWQARMDVSCI